MLLNHTNHIWQYLGVALLFVCQNHLYGQVEDGFINLTTRDGLPSNIVYEVIQDQQGYVWFATELGISRYNGEKFVNYSKKDGLPDNDILGLFEDSQGRIWFKTLNGELGYYWNGNIYNKKNKAFLKYGGGKGFIANIVEDNQGTIYVGFFRKGYLKIMPDESVHTYFDFSQGSFPVYHQGSVTVFNTGRAESVMRNNNMDTLDFMTPTYAKITGSNHYYFMNRIAFNEVYMLDSSFQLVHRIDLSPLIVNDVKNDLERVWILTEQGVLEFEAPKNFKLKYPISGCTDILTDTYGNTWVTSKSSGVYLKEHEDQLWRIKQISDQSINGLGKLSEDVWWFSTYTDSLYFLDHMSNLLEEKKMPACRGVNNIYMINGDTVMLSERCISIGNRTYGSSSYRSLIPYKGNYLVTSSLRLAVLTPNHFKNLPTSRHTFHVPEDKSHILKFDLTSSTNEIVQTSPSEVIVTSNQGVYFLEIPNLNDSVSEIRHIYEDYSVPCITKGKDGTYWLGTDVGVIQIDENGNEFIRFDQELSSSMVSGIASDQDHIWVGTGNGLNVIMPAGDQYKVIQIDRGNGNLNRISHLELVGETVFIASSMGVFSVELNKQFNYNLHSPLYISNFKSNNLIYRTDSKIILPPETQNVSITYESVNFGREGNTYRYKLEKDKRAEDTWQYTDETELSIWSIESGKYRFTVQNNLANGDWSESETLSFTVQSIFYKTYWFWVIIVIALITIAVTITLRVKHVRNRELELRNQLISTRLNALRAQINPHFIFNALNSIQKFILRNDHSVADSYLSKFSKLMRYTIDHADMMLVTIDEEINTLQLYFDMELLRVNTPFKYSFEVDESIDPYVTNIPAMVIQPFVENSIWHGISGLDNGVITIRFKQLQELLEISIEDNGKGFCESKITDKSKGIQLVKDRFEMFKAYYKGNFSLEILSHEHEVKGTRVVMKISNVLL